MSKSGISIFADNLRALPRNLRTSLFRHEAPVTDRSRSQAIFSNLFLHIHATRTHLRSLKPTARIAGILENYRKSWTENAAEREIFGSPVTEPLLGAMRAMFIADTDAEAESVARPAYAKWFDSLNWLWLHRGLEIPIAISPRRCAKLAFEKTSFTG